MRTATSIALLFLIAGFTAPAQAQEESQSDLKIVVEPAELHLEMNETAHLKAKVLDAAGNEMDGPILFFSRSRRSVSVTPEGEVKALKPGSFTLFVGRGRGLFAEVPVHVAFPPVTSVAFAGVPAMVYEGTTIVLNTKVEDAAGMMRDNVEVMMTSSDPSIASLNAYGELTAYKPGRVTLMADAEGNQAEAIIEVVANPTARVALSGGTEQVRTGDVIDFDAKAYDDGGQLVDAPITYSVLARPDDNLGPSASALVEQDGRFVAETSGLYTVVATSGNHSDRFTVRAEPRNVRREARLVGKGIVSNVNTSDIWAWEGVDGRDYAVTGTWNANGEAYFWDVTDPASPAIIDTVTVDARTVNDVKVSEDGSLCIISREGASSRKNGIVLLDCTNPYDVKIHTEYTDGLTGGVHNLFIYDGHVFALSAGQRYDILNVEDPKNPRKVGSFELDTPGHSIHDVWVVDGIAYSSNWSDGVWMVDVGNGIAGGSVENPVVIGNYAYPSGWNHAAIPYKSADTGKFYIIAGDEASINGKMAGYAHFIDFTDPKNPKEVARYEVPEAGTHNMWIEGDKLYIAYYQGGLRVVDLSGDLMGDLYKQGREVAKFYTEDPEGFAPNSSMAWGPIVHKGNVFVSDMNSGLWVIKIEEDEEQQPGL